MLAQCRFVKLPQVFYWKKEWWLRGTAVLLLLIALIIFRQPIHRRNHRLIQIM